MSDFQAEVRARIEANGSNAQLQTEARALLLSSIDAMYSYNFSWLSRPIIQYPQDIIAVQELIWQTRPDLVIETGIAHGGSIIMTASMLAMLDYCDAVESGQMLDPQAPARRVVGVDIDIRADNRRAIETHPMASRIDMIEGSSISPETIERVHAAARGYDRIMVMLDSNHTRDHVLAELEAYAPLTSKGSYCIVFDTVIEDLPDTLIKDRPWRKGNNPKTAVWEFLKSLGDEDRRAFDGDRLSFEIDKMVENKLLITVAPDGFLKRIP
jgi:cephalosporin hydroxylase